MQRKASSNTVAEMEECLASLDLSHPFLFNHIPSKATTAIRSPALIPPIDNSFNFPLSVKTVDLVQCSSPIAASWKRKANMNSYAQLLEYFACLLTEFQHSSSSRHAELRQKILNRTQELLAKFVTIIKF